MRECLDIRINCEIKHNTLKNLDKEEKNDNYQNLLYEAMEKYVIALSLEPTMEEINNLPAEVRKGTELETVLMQFKNLTTRYVKKQKDIRKWTIEEINTKLSMAGNSDDLDGAQNLISKTKTFKEEFFQQE